MIDSIRFSVEQRVSDKDLRDWKTSVFPMDDGKILVTYERNIDVGNAKFNIKYIPISKYTGRPLISVFISSVPKMFHNNNYVNVLDIEAIISVINEEMSEVFPSISVDYRFAKLSRCDFAICYYVGANVSSYIQVLSQKHYPHRNRNIFNNRVKHPSKLDLTKFKESNGVSYFSQKITSSFYGKEWQSRDPMAYGLLRHEVRISGKKALVNHTGLSKPRLCDLKPEISLKILNKDLQVLSLNQETHTKLNLHQSLATIFGLEDALSYFHMINDLNLYPGIDRKTQAEKLGVSYQTIGIWNRKLKANSLSPSYSPSNVTLPPLHASFDEDGSINKYNKVQGDTRQFPICSPDDTVKSPNKEKIENKNNN